MGSLPEMIPPLSPLRLAPCLTAFGDMAVVFVMVGLVLAAAIGNENKHRCHQNAALFCVACFVYYTALQLVQVSYST